MNGTAAPRRILLVSKFSTFQGGVERHLFDLRDALTQRGYAVRLFASEDVLADGGTRFDKDVRGLTDRARAARDLLWSPAARASLRRVIAEFAPDVIHYHSIYHQLSPSVLRLGSVPSVMTLHDYKLAAPCYTLYRDGAICTACVGRALPTPALTYRCIGDGRAASALCATEHLVHRSRYNHAIDRFIVPSSFAADRFLDAGIPAEKMTVVPWGVVEEPVAGAFAGPESTRDSTVRAIGFVGRLHETKGIGVLLDAWAMKSDVRARLVIAGAGEFEPQVRAATAADPTIEYLGLVEPHEVERVVKEVDAVMVPSLFPETMGLSAIECLVAGTPIVSSGRGALADLAGPGVVTLADVSPATLAEAIDELCANDGRGLDGLTADLRARDLSMYRQSRMIDDIIRVYEHAVSGA